MGNSHSSNNKDVVKALVGKIEGVPIWPPVKSINLLDVIVVKKNGNINVLQNHNVYKLQGLNDEDVKKIEALEANPTVDETKPSYTISSKNGATNGANVKLIQALNVGGGFNYDHNSSVTIQKPVTTRIDTGIKTKDALIELSKILENKAKIHKLYNRHGKRVYVVTEVTKAKGYTVSSSEGADVNLHLTLPEGSGGDVTFERSKDASFDAKDPVIISIKAVRFDVSKEGLLHNPKQISVDSERTTSGDVGMTPEDHEDFVPDEEEEKVDGKPATGRRMALLIGNNDYKHVRKLGGCHEDIAIFTDYFERRGIECEAKEDMTYKATLDKMNHYVTELKKDDMFIFHYSGHGSTRRSISKSTGGFEATENTICPVDTAHKAEDGDGINRDISRDVIQAWMGALEDKGVKVFVIFDSCHSGGMIRTSEDADPLEKEVEGDVREGSTAELPDYPWLEKVRNNEHIDAALENVAFLSACKHYETAKECKNEEGVVQGGALSLSLRKILESNEGKNLSFQQIMDSVAFYIRTTYKKDQRPDVSGNINTVAFCFDNVMKVSPFPYNVVQIVKACDKDEMTLQFMSLYLLPIITPKSQYVLYKIGDTKMAKKMATFEIQSSSQRDNTAIVNVIDDYDEELDEVSSAELFRVVEIKHVQGDPKHYTKVCVQASNPDNGCNKKNLDLLTSTLTDLKKDMYDHRTSYPVMKLPPTAFVTLVQNEEDCDIKVKLDGEHIAVVDMKNDNLVLPKVELKNADMDVRLVASYIASYAHWNMLRNLKSSHPDKVSITLDEGLSMGKNTVAIEIYGQDDFDEYDSKIEPTRVSNEGYEYHLNWDDSEDGTQPFRVCIRGDVTKKSHVMVALLDLDYDISYDDTEHLLVEAGGHKDLVLIDEAVLKIDQDIVKKTKADGRWCKPYFEFQIFVCFGDVIGKAGQGESPNLCDGLYGITSEGIKEPYYDIENDENFDSTKGKGRSKAGKASPWACIPIKIYVEELKEYAREV